MEKKGEKKKKRGGGCAIISPQITFRKAEECQWRKGKKGKKEKGVHSSRTLCEAFCHYSCLVSLTEQQRRGKGKKERRERMDLGLGTISSAWHGERFLLTACVHNSASGDVRKKKEKKEKRREFRFGSSYQVILNSKK